MTKKMKDFALPCRSWMSEERKDKSLANFSKLVRSRKEYAPGTWESVRNKRESIDHDWDEGPLLARRAQEILRLRRCWMSVSFCEDRGHADDYAVTSAAFNYDIARDTEYGIVVSY